MGGEVCHQVGRERGPWFQIKCVKNDILNKEAKGIDASFERGLLKSWRKYPGWESAEMPSRKAIRSKSTRVGGR